MVSEQRIWIVSLPLIHSHAYPLFFPSFFTRSLCLCLSLLFFILGLLCWLVLVVLGWTIYWFEWCWDVSEDIGANFCHHHRHCNWILVVEQQNNVHGCCVCGFLILRMASFFFFKFKYCWLMCRCCLCEFLVDLWDFRWFLVSSDTIMVVSNARSCMFECFLVVDDLCRCWHSGLRKFLSVTTHQCCQSW